MKYCPECKMRYADSAKRCVLHKLQLVPVVDTRLGQIVAGRYVIEAVLGEGGMATVYRARLKLGGRYVAIKVLNKALARDEKLRERFDREIKLAATLVHPNVVTTEDHGELEDGCPFLVMELLEGEKLEELIQRGPIPVPRALSLMLQIAHTVARAHDLEILHRDLKPENVHVCVADGGGDHVKVIDFGIARSMQDTRITESGELFGTPQYLSPERIGGGDHTPSDDLYALGVMFFEMLTGRLPFIAPDSTSYFLKQLHELPPAPKTIVRAIPDRLNRLILQLLEKKAAARPVDARRVTQELLAMLHEADEEPPPSVTQPFRREDLLLRPAKPAISNAWTVRLDELRRTLVTRYGRLPEALRQEVTEAEALVAELTATRESAFLLEAELEAIADESHASRLRLGAAVDTLGNDLSAARESARDSYLRRDELARESEDARALIRASEREVSGFGPPHRAEHSLLPMANAYRMLALAIETLAEAEHALEHANTELAKRMQAQADLSYQVDQLRTALQQNESGTSTKTDALGRRLEASWEREQELEAAAMRALQKLEANDPPESA